jgi:hypothetical protein
MWPQRLTAYDGRVSSSQYVHIIAKMIFDEPCVYGLIANQQSLSLKHGIMVRWGYTPPTPSFQEHINRHYLPFCRDAILLFLAVGFVPFRIRQEGHVQVPEALPLGTFSWSVCGSDSKHRNVSKKKKRPRRESAAAAAAEAEEQQADNSHHSSEPLLVYDVTCAYCEEDIHVFNFVQPHAMLDCFSPLAVLIPQYNALCSVRELALRTLENNAHHNIAIEEQDKTLLNSVADTGACIARMPNHLSQVCLGCFFVLYRTLFLVFSQGLQQAELDSRLQTVQAAVEVSKQTNQLPHNARAFVVPKNNIIKPLDKPTPPPDVQEREAAFARSVAMVLGLPSGAQVFLFVL